MKGVCIMIVAFNHCLAFDGVGSSRLPQRLILMLCDVELPLFFFVAGLFFSRRQSFADFFLNKVERLLVPYLFFAFVPNLCLDWVNGYEYSWGRMWELLADSSVHPIWFLLCLFFLHHLYYAFTLLARRLPAWAVHTLAVGVPLAAGLAAAPHYEAWRAVPVVRGALYETYLLTALVVLPFFHMGAVTRSRGWLTARPRGWRLAALLLTACVVWTACAVGGIDPHPSVFTAALPRYYLCCAADIVAIWCLCRVAGSAPVLSYLGRKSLLVLGWHIHLLGLVIWHTPLRDPYAIMLLMTLLALPACAVTSRLFPHLTAQRHIFRSPRRASAAPHTFTT